MDENVDDFRSSQRPTAGSEENPKQSSADEKETGPTTPTKVLKRTLSIDEQAEAKNSPKKKVLSDSSEKVLVEIFQCFWEESNLFSTEIMDEESNLEKSQTACNINETEFKLEEKDFRSRRQSLLKMYKNVDDFRSSQRPTAGSEETPKQSSTDDKKTGPKTPTKALKRTLSINEQAEAKNSPQKKIRSGSDTFNPDMGALINEVITKIVGENRVIDTEAENWRNRHPSLEIHVPEDDQAPNHQSLMEQLSTQLERFLVIVNAANNSIESVLDSIRALRPHFNVLRLTNDMIITVLNHSREVRSIGQNFHSMVTNYGVDIPYRLYYQDFWKSLVCVHNSLRGILEQLKRISDYIRTKFKKLGGP